MRKKLETGWLVFFFFNYVHFTSEAEMSFIHWFTLQVHATTRLGSDTPSHVDGRDTGTEGSSTLGECVLIGSQIGSTVALW